MTNKTDKVIAVFGSTLLTDNKLMKRLKNEFQVVPCSKIEKLMSILNKLNVSAILMEIDEDDAELKPLTKAKSKHSKIPIIALGEGRQQDLIAKAFQRGVCDFFKVPYKVDLLMEKIKSL